MLLPLRAVATAAVAACITGAAPASRAQAFDAVRLYSAAPGHDGGTVGTAFIAGTAYPGSAKDRNLIVPLLDYQWRNGWFAGVSNGIGINVSSRPDQQFGLRLSADLGRKSSRSAALSGLPDIDAKPEIGAFFNHTLSPALFLTSSLRYGAGQHGCGLVLDLGAGHSTVLAPQWRLGVGVAASVVNGGWMQSYFGVSPAQATASGYPAYRPAAGLRDGRANVALTYQMASRASITGAASVGTWLGDARSSPLMRKSTTLTGLVLIGYAF